ncbi:copper chaperone PCu(A)C [Methylocystis sp. S23]
MKIESPWLRAGDEKDANLFLSVHNDGDMPDKLVAVRTPRFRKAVIHADPARIIVPHGVVIPSHATVLMEPGRPYVSLHQAGERLAVGESVELELVFEKAGKVTVEASVEAPDAKKADDAEAMARWKSANEAKPAAAPESAENAAAPPKGPAAPQSPTPAAQ